MPLENRALIALSSSLVGDEPRRALDRVCQALHVSSEAEGLALVAQGPGGGMTLLVARDLPLDARAGLGGLLAKSRPAVVTEEGGNVIAPLGGGASGALFLLQPKALDRSTLELYQLVIGQAVAALQRTGPGAASLGLPTEAVATYLGQTSGSEVQKAQLLTALEKHEWNLALVARKLGVTRRTIYQRLAKYGIPRKRVPKHYKLLRPQDADA